MKGVYAYLDDDDVIICGNVQDSHDKNLEVFLLVAKKYVLTRSENKCSFPKKFMNLFGYRIENQTLKPDLERLGPLQNLPCSNDSASLRRIIGMFSHYFKWIPRFSSKIRR